MPENALTTQGVDLLPVVVGGDIGAYSLARAFHEAYGIRTVVVSRLAGWVVGTSALIDNVRCEDPFDAEKLAPVLQRIAEEHPERPLLLLGSADSTVKAIIEVRDRIGLDDRYLAPYVSRDTFAAATEKQNFTRLCQDLGVDHPGTVVVDCTEEIPEDLEIPFEFPVIAKPAEVSDWKRVTFPGQSKVHTVASREELGELLRAIRGAGYRSSIIVQDRIPGDDQFMRILTVYCDADSRVRFASWGRTLLEEHAPGAIGNPAAIITGVDPEMVAQAQRLCTELGWTGYANFDLKYDQRDGRTKFFELNPRLGRSNYYITAGGHNPVTWYVDEHFRHALPTEGPGSGVGEDGIVQDQPEVLYTVVPTALVRRYTTQPEARAQLRRVLKAGRVRNPLRYPGVETDAKRRGYALAAAANFVLKFQRHYRPEGGDRLSRLVPRRAASARAEASPGSAAPPAQDRA
ncbi:carboxylate--amine ligase [Brachybacterium sp. AOP43-C2-M15]|uniref:carboxylate--amine ligase n=1 Tax=Brachybacterium sp. AOP43-C2-M15 TaxID=3457661 RepID=UPI00403410A7